MPPPKVVISGVRFEIPPSLVDDPYSRQIVNEYSDGSERVFGTQGPPLLEWLSTMIQCHNDELPKRFVLAKAESDAKAEERDPGEVNDPDAQALEPALEEVAPEVLSDDPEEPAESASELQEVSDAVRQG